MKRKAYRCSASQTDTGELCTRKWAFPKLDGLVAPQNEYAAFGSRTHKILEAWFRDCTPPQDTPEGRVARKILGHLPPPQTPGLLVEREIDLVLGGVPFKGFVDLSLFEGQQRPFVSDHKTCGSFTYCLEPETMHEDVQVANYSYEAMLRTNSQEVDVQWTYGTRDGKRSKPVSAVVTYDMIKPRLEKTAATANRLKEIFESGVTAIEVPYDASGCDAFGGCPFKEQCNLTPQERFQSVMNQKSQESAFLSKLRKKKGNNAAATHPPAANTEPTTAPAPVPTTSGTVNPPSAPATAPANPEGEPPKPPKKKGGRRSKKPPTVPAAAPAATPAPVNLKPAQETTARPAGIIEDVGAVIPVETVIRIAMASYKDGFNDGFVKAFQTMPPKEVS